MFGNSKRVERKLRENGRSATATVVECHSGMTINTGPAGTSNSLVICKLQLQVAPDGEAGFHASTSNRCSAFRIPRSGDTMRVLFDPEDHSRVVIDHSEAASAQDALTSRLAHFRAQDTELGSAIANQLEAENVPGGPLQFPTNDPAAISAFEDRVDSIIRDAKAAAVRGPRARA
jgi:hypothetical protein